MSRHRFTHVRAIAVATSFLAVLTLVSCTEQRLDEHADGAQLGTTTTFAVPTTAAGLISGTSPLRGMHGVVPGAPITPVFRRDVHAVDPTADARVAAAAAYDAVLITAIAAETVRIDAPGRIASAIVDVTGKGRKCVKFATCRALALRNTDLDYDGVSGAVELFANGDPGEATYRNVTYTANGTLVRSGPITAQGTPPAGGPNSAQVANPIFGPAGDGVLRFGTLLPVQGPRGDVARSALAGVRLGVNELNSNGGVLGVPAQLVADETGDGSGSAVATAVQRLINEHVDAVIGGTDYSITSAALGPVTDAGLILFSPTDAADALSTANTRGLFFRTIAPNSLQGQVIGRLLTDEGYTRVAIATDPTADDQALAGLVGATLFSSGTTITATVTTGPAAGIDTLLAGDPQAVVLATGVAQTAAWVRALDAKGKSPKVLPTYGTTTNMTPDLVNAVGAI